MPKIVPKTIMNENLPPNTPSRIKIMYSIPAPARVAMSLIFKIDYLEDSSILSLFTTESFSSVYSFSRSILFSIRMLYHEIIFFTSEV